MAQANERIVNGVKTRLLHNKDYVEVAERLRIVHTIEQEQEKPFEMVESAPFQIDNRILWKVAIKFNDRLFIGHAEVKMDAPKNTPDGTNPFECAETSAMGRALAFAGLGTLESIASYEEVARMQPFARIVEQPANPVVEAGNAPRQLPQAKTHITKEQIKPIYQRGGRLKLYTNEAEFWGWVAHVLGWDEANLSKLSVDLLADLNAIMDSEEQRKAQPVTA